MIMNPWTLPARLDRAAAAALAPQWADAMPDSGAVTIDASAVERIGQAGWQVLLSAMRTAKAKGTTLRITGSSPAMIESATLAGLADLLEECT
jgi:anti-anti-sigma regulatory factor